MPATTSTSRPRSPADLFFSFSLIVLQGFGGVIGIIQRELVERKRWLTNEEFVEDWTVAQVMPGPNIVNLALLLGSRHFGLPGAISAVAGVLLLPLALVLTLGFAYGHLSGHPGIAGALRGMGAAATGLIAAAGLRMAVALRKHPLGVPLTLALGVMCFAAVAFLKLPLAFALLGLGSLSCVLTYLRLRP